MLEQQLSAKPGCVGGASLLLNRRNRFSTHHAPICLTPLLTTLPRKHIRFLFLCFSLRRQGLLDYGIHWLLTQILDEHGEGATARQQATPTSPILTLSKRRKKSEQLSPAQWRKSPTCSMSYGYALPSD